MSRRKRKQLRISADTVFLLIQNFGPLVVDIMDERRKRNRYGARDVPNSDAIPGPPDTPEHYETVIEVEQI